MAGKKTKVVVFLEYDGKRLRADGTVSFPTARPDMGVLEAKAKMVNGVKYAHCGLGDTTQELEVTVTAYHAQTLQSSLAVMRAVAGALNVAVIGGIRVDDRTEKDEPSKKGKKTKKK